MLAVENDKLVVVLVVLFGLVVLVDVEYFELLVLVVVVLVGYFGLVLVVVVVVHVVLVVDYFGLVVVADNTCVVDKGNYDSAIEFEPEAAKVAVAGAPEPPVAEPNAQDEGVEATVPHVLVEVVVEVEEQEQQQQEPEVLDFLLAK